MSRSSPEGRRDDAIVILLTAHLRGTQPVPRDELVRRVVGGMRGAENLGAAVTTAQDVERLIRRLVNRRQVTFTPDGLTWRSS